MSRCDSIGFTWEDAWDWIKQAGRDVVGFVEYRFSTPEKTANTLALGGAGLAFGGFILQRIPHPVTVALGIGC